MKPDMKIKDIKIWGEIRLSKDEDKSGTNNLCLRGLG